MNETIQKGSAKAGDFFILEVQEKKKFIAESGQVQIGGVFLLVVVATILIWIAHFHCFSLFSTLFLLLSFLDVSGN